MLKNFEISLIFVILQENNNVDKYKLQNKII